MTQRHGRFSPAILSRLVFPLPTLQGHSRNQRSSTFPSCHKETATRTTRTLTRSTKPCSTNPRHSLLRQLQQVKKAPGITKNRNKEENKNKQNGRTIFSLEPAGKLRLRPSCGSRGQHRSVPRASMSPAAGATLCHHCHGFSLLIKKTTTKPPLVGIMLVTNRNLVLIAIFCWL